MEQNSRRDASMNQHNRTRPWRLKGQGERVVGSRIRDVDDLAPELVQTCFESDGQIIRKNVIVADPIFNELVFDVYETVQRYARRVCLAEGDDRCLPQSANGFDALVRRAHGRSNQC